MSIPIDDYILDDKVIDNLYIKNGKMYTKNKIRIIVPRRYEKGGYLSIGRTTETIALALVLDENNKAALMLKPNLFESIPSTISYEKVNDKDYVIMSFDKGDIVMNSTRLIINPDIIGWLFVEWITATGNIPYYLGYEDVFRVFVEPTEYGDKIGRRPVDVGVLISSIAYHGPNNEAVRFLSMSEQAKTKIKWYGLSNIQITINTPTSLLSGGYINAGITKMLINDNLPGAELEMLLA